MGVTGVVCLFTVGAALLGLWLVARFPSVGPQTVTWSLVAVIGAFGVLQLTNGLTGSVARTYGPGTSLVLVILPTLTLAFWACARLVRAFVSMVSPFSG
jgi:hypothetical protein